MLLPSIHTSCVLNQDQIAGNDILGMNLNEFLKEDAHVLLAYEWTVVR